MRFLADGPSVPDELLVARDEGRVLFFCGSGVSRAQAKLPDFLGLAERVLDELRALPDSAPRTRAINASRCRTANTSNTIKVPPGSISSTAA